MNPCLHCKDRYPACQSHCDKPEHLAYDEKRKVKRELIAKAKAELAFLEEYKADAIIRQKRRAKAGGK